MSLHPDLKFGKPAETETRGPGSEPRGNSGINSGKDIDVNKLRDAMTWSRKALRPFQEQYFEAVQYFAGSRYGKNTELPQTPMNLLHLAVEIWLRQLAAQTPRCLVLTRQPDLKMSAFELEIATDFLMKEIRFGANLSECVRSAIFCMGIMKVGITEPYLAEGSPFTAAVGQPFAEPVLFEDWIHDMNARRPEEWDWCGNRYKVPLEVVRNNPEFDPSVRRALAPKEHLNATEDLATSTTVRSNRLSTDDDPTREEYREHVELWDIWIPSQNLMITLPGQDGLDPLLVREWKGPKHGPYHLLGFTNVPGNIVPAAPAQTVYDIQDLITRIFNQMGEQALRQKTLTIADGRAVEDGTAERVMEGQDGQVIRTSHIDGIKEMKYGGVDPNNQAFAVWLREIFSYMGGNIDAMGGLAQQAGTLGQEQLLVQSSSEMIRDMQAKVIEFTKNVVRDMAWYMYNDPQIELPLTKHIEDFGDIPFDWGPEDRKTNFFEYNFDIQPYSLQHKGPAQRLQTIMQLMTTVFLPLAPQMELWGVSFNMQKFVELVSKYADLPELGDLIGTELPTPYEEMYATSSAGMGGGHSERAKQSPVTQRNYTRANIPTGGTQQARNGNLMGQLLQAGKKNA